jgi:hypothetical protein
MVLLPGEVVHDSIPETMEMLVARTKQMISAMLDSAVQSRGYDGIVSCVSYVGDPNPRFDAEARAAREWRSAVYSAGYAILAEVPEGVTTPEQVLALMPKLEDFGWPA